MAPADNSSLSQQQQSVVQRLRARYLRFRTRFLGWVGDLFLFSETRFSRAVRRPMWKGFYASACRDFLPQGYMNFLNLGYLSDTGELDAEKGVGIADHVSARLYDQVVRQVDLKGRTVVEVGCGPGTGSAHLTRTYQPASFVGIDLSENMIEWCRDHHDLPNLRFLQGDAQSLPVASDSVDAVINVESSHCYPSRLRFFEEVERILRPGGSFLFADLIFPSDKGEASEVVSDLLSEAGLLIEDYIDITDNVLAARDAVSRSSSFHSRIREHMPARAVPFLEEIMFLVGSRNHETMVSREVRYCQWRALKPRREPSVTASTAEALAS
jgi:ubiquinone/menaquinone biosynthesis C-methylase UbiE